jgi:HK97 family phage portal protein
MAMTPLHYYRRGESGRARADDAGIGAMLLNGPNGHQSAFEFFELLWGDVLLAGNFYAFVSRDFRGQPVAMTRLKPGTVLISEFFDRAEGRILFYDATLPDGTRERFAARHIWHVKGLSRDGINGVNPIPFMRDALGGAIATSNHASTFWSRGGRPSTVLQSKQKIAAGDKEQIRNDWSRLHGSMDGEMIAVLDQELSANFLSHDMRASQFLETRQFQVVDLARIWGVPPHLIFDLSRSTNNNIEHQSLEFVIYHLGPHYARLAGAATKQFAAPGHYFEHMTDALVKGDLKSRMEAYWLQRQMGIANADELRARENAPKIGGEAGSEYWRPSNMALAGTPFQPGAVQPPDDPAPPVPQPPAPQPADDDESEEGDE